MEHPCVGHLLANKRRSVDKKQTAKRHPCEQVASLILEVQRVHARLGTLSDFNYRMSEEDIRLSWRTMDYPTVRLFVLPDKYVGSTDLSVEIVACQPRGRDAPHTRTQRIFVTRLAP